MRLTIETPALLFAPIAFLVLAYTNRYSALTRLARELLREYATDQEEHVFEQILLVRRRVNVIRSMLTLAALAMSFSVFTILALYEDWDGVAKVLFTVALAMLTLSYVLAIVEIRQSTRALDVQMLNTLEALPPGPLEKLQNDLRASWLGRKSAGR
ncbi:MAG: DUF2721 domain-containing protein [Ilumatobacteraceae bacterium]|nr:MAG: DUF2721 domain-containing protein [Actinomycetota bacterium]